MCSTNVTNVRKKENAKTIAVDTDPSGIGISIIGSFSLVFRFMGQS